MIQFDEHVFQMGWFNHQPVKMSLFEGVSNKPDLGSHGRHQNFFQPPVGVPRVNTKHLMEIQSVIFAIPTVDG